MSDLNKQFEELNNTPDTTAEFDTADIENNKIYAIFAYLSWLVLIPIFAAKDSKFARYHVNQGLVLAIVELVFGVVIGVLSGIPVLGVIFGLIGGVLELVCLCLSVLGILNAATGKAKELPVIGSIRLFK